jgi:hypothetical protein
MRGWTLLLLAGPVLAGCESNAGKTTPAATSSTSVASTAPAANSANLTKVVLEVPGMT